MMDDNDKEILLEFIAECVENLESVTQSLIMLEENPSSDDSVIDGIFRSIHTIKGTSGIFSFTKLEKIAHFGENILNQLRKKDCELTHDLNSLLLEMVDSLKTILAHISVHYVEPDQSYDSLINRLEVAVSSENNAAAAKKASEQSGSAGETHADECSAVVSNVEKIEAVEEVQIVLQQPEPIVETKNNNSNNDPNPEIVANDTAKNDNNKAEVLENTIRVNVVKLDKLMDLVSELVLVRNQILQLVNEQKNLIWAQASQNLNQITSELQENIMNMRMQPINTIWKKYPRLVRDFALSSGKEIKLEMIGAETELDKSTIEAIKDPLTHLLRNAIDHGIETSEIRHQQGKPGSGHIQLAAKHESGYVNIQIKDDGQGINFQKVKSKAIEKKIITAEETKILSKNQLIQLIFKPGFSTADQITQVSGRGVGMDVVKTNIEKIGGLINIDTEEGSGSTFTIKIPLTMAIVKVIIIEINDDVYAIPQNCLIQLLRLRRNDKKNKIEKVGSQHVYRLRDKLLPLVSLKSILFSDVDEGDEMPEILNVVVLSVNNNEFGLVVDKIRDTKEIVVKPLEGILKDIPIYSGATILGDGSVALILEVNGIADLSNMKIANDIKQEVENENLSTERKRNQDAMVHDSLILVEIEDHLRVAVPLNEVVRLEEIPLKIIERAGNSEVVQYRETIMPLISLSNILSGNKNSASLQTLSKNDKIAVLVCENKSVTIGIVVNAIIDIVNSDECEITPPTRPHSVGNMVIQKRTTELIDLRKTLNQLDYQFEIDTVDAK